MADDVEMTPVEMIPVEAVEPPKVNPLAKPAAPVAAKPVLKPGATVSALKPGLKLPPKPGATVSALKPGLKLPPKPGATVSALKPGLKLPPKPGLATGLKLPPKPGMTTIGKPVIRKPGEATGAAPLPKPLPKPVVPVDAQGVGKLPTVEAKAIDRADVAATPVEVPKPMEALKSVTQKLKGITQQIPQQAILRKTGIIAESAAQTEAQKEAAKHKTARISLSDAMGVAPVKNEPAPMKTIRIKRPVNLTSGTSTTLTPQPRPEAPKAEVSTTPAPVDSAAATAPASAPTEESSVTQRKTLKITRPGGAVRPSGKFSIKKPATQAPTLVKKPAGEKQPEAEVADIPDLPPVTAAAPVVPQTAAAPKPGAGTTITVIFKLVATLAIGALVWFFYENSQLPTYCGGLGWGQ